jgi:hypothetical protein
MDIDEKPVPERMEEVENGSLFAIQKTELKEIAVKKVKKRPHVKRHMQPEFFQAKRALVGVTEPRGAYRIRAEALAAKIFFSCQLLRIATVLLDPEGDVVFFLVGLDQIVLQLRGRTADMEMVIDQVVFIRDYRTRAEQLEQIFRVVAAMANPLSTEDLTARDVESADIAAGGGDGLNLSSQFRGDSLVGIQPQNPFAVEGEILQRPFPLARMRIEGVLVDDCAEITGDCPRVIGAAGIDDEDFESPVAYTAQAGLEVLRLVEGQNDDRDRAALYAATSFEVTVSIE